MSNPISNKKQQGLTLIELLVTMAIIGAIATVTVFVINMNKSKGQIAFMAAQNVAQAAERYQVDNSCYPYTVQQLFSNPGNGTANSCGIPLGPTWSGPYMKAVPVNTAGAMLLPKLGPTTAATIQSGDWVNMSGITTEYAVVIDNLPQSIAKQALTACSNNINETTSGSYTVAGNCFIGTPNGGLNSFGYVFASQQ